MADPDPTYGWTAVPRDTNSLLKGKKNVVDPRPVKVNDVQLPDTERAKKVMAYARTELSEETFNHSMRVYYYGVMRF